jgi:hypothetical protein
MEILQLPRSLRCPLAFGHTECLLLTDSLATHCPIDNTDRVETPFIVVLQSFVWEQVCLRRRYSVTTAYTCLLRISCLAADVVSLFVFRSLPSNGSTRYSILILFSAGLW